MGVGRAGTTDQIIAKVGVDIANEGKDNEVPTILLLFGIDGCAHDGHAVNVVEKLPHGEIVHDPAYAGADEMFCPRWELFAVIKDWAYS